MSQWLQEKFLLLLLFSHNFCCLQLIILWSRTACCFFGSEKVNFFPIPCCPLLSYLQSEYALKLKKKIHTGLASFPEFELQYKLQTCWLCQRVLYTNCGVLSYWTIRYGQQAYIQLLQRAEALSTNNKGFNQLFTWSIQWKMASSNSKTV